MFDNHPATTPFAEQIKQELNIPLTVGKSFSPYLLNFAVSYFCVSGCKNCNIWKLGGDAKKGELNLEEIRRLSRNERGFKWIRFTGGEPFMRLDLPEIVKEFAENSDDLKLVNITTNSFNPEFITRTTRRLTEQVSNIVIGISLEGSKELHNFIRGIDSFDKAIDLFKRLKGITGTKVLFSYTVSPYNVGRFDESFHAVKRLIPEITVNDFNFNLYGVSPIYYQNSDASLAESTKRLLALEFEKLLVMRQSHKEGTLADRIIDRYLELMPHFLDTGHSPITCSAILSSVFLDPYGNVFPCITWDKKLGNIREADYSIAKIIERQIVRDSRLEIKTNRCPGCWTPCEAHESIIDEALSRIDAT
jgi:MoaA/NifB/PqqE/SkfB family radical SAM enzyme